MSCRITEAQFYALRQFVAHVAPTNCGPRSYPGVDAAGPFDGRHARVWTALEARGLIAQSGRGRIESGSFSWTMPIYKITEAGLAAYEASVKRSPEGDSFAEPSRRGR